MILVACLNLALDDTYRAAEVRSGETHRVELLDRRAGGKGVNVARVLRQLGAQVCLIGFAGGGTGADAASDVENAGIRAAWTPVTGPTRRTIAVVDDSATVFNEAGPTITIDEWAALLANAANLLDEQPDLLVLSGSIPPGVPTDAYAQLTERAAARGVRTILDTSGPALQAALRAQPFLAKPNAAEAAAVAGGDDVLEALLRAGAENAVVSNGSAGLDAVLDNRRYHVSVPAIAGNPTGAGDGLTAAIASGVVSGHAWPDILRDATAIACGVVAVAHAGEFDARVADEVRNTVLVQEQAR